MLLPFFIGVLFTVYIIMIFFNPFFEGTWEETTILFYFHVPMAWIGAFAFLGAALFAILYLKQRKYYWDYWMSASAELGFLFTILATITGAIWARMEWSGGLFWNWDPKQIGIVILLLIYIAFFTIRSNIRNGELKSRLSAVYAILAFAMTPFLLIIIPRIQSKLHPKDKAFSMSPEITLIFIFGLVLFTVLYVYLLWLRIRVHHLHSKN
jgi:heme exporter protein C